MKISFLLWMILIASFAFADSDLAVQMSDAPDPVAIGTDLTYMIVVTNLGPGEAQHIELSDSLPNSMTFESVAAPEEWACTTPQLGVPGVITCRSTKLAVNANSTLMIVVKPISLGVITNSASLAGSDPDPNASNNQASQETTVVAGKGEPHQP
jgi:uncharacterized repeat protein (TIGR01451 family)